MIIVGIGDSEIVVLNRVRQLLIDDIDQHETTVETFQLAYSECDGLPGLPGLRTEQTVSISEMSIRLSTKTKPFLIGRRTELSRKLGMKRVRV